MHKNNKLEGEVISNVIHRHVKDTEPQKQIKLIIYNIKFKTSYLIVKNNSNSPKLS